MDFRKRGTRLGLSLESGEPEEQAGLPRTALWTGNKRRPSGVSSDLQSRHDSLKLEPGSLRLVSWGCSVSNPNRLVWWPQGPSHSGQVLSNTGARTSGVLGDFRGRKSKRVEASSDVAHLGNGALEFEKTIQDVNWPLEPTGRL